MTSIEHLHINDSTPAITTLIIKNGIIVNNYVQGSARLDNGICLLKANTSTAFNICSMSKHITAAAILFLEESGKLSLDHKIGAYLSDLPDELSNITIIELLFHTSGIQNYTDNGNFQQVDNNIKNGIIYDKQKLYSEILNLKITENKGRFAYSNSGYFLLSTIIEKVSGLEYFSFLKNSIFRNTVLSNTFMVHDYQNHENYAEPYSSWPIFKPTNWIKAIHPLGDGGLMMSINDFANWILALTNEKVFNQSKTLEKFFPSTVKNS